MKARMVFADENGEIFDHPVLEVSAKSGSGYMPVPGNELIPLPDGSKLFTMPGRIPVGWDVKGKAAVPVEEVEFKGRVISAQAVSAFLPPAYTRTLLPAALKREGSPALPLWAYAAVGWRDNQFVVAGVRVDETPYWDPERYDDRTLLPLVEKRMHNNENRLLEHLKRCATEYHCFAAKNLFYGRLECPVPVSPVCNADCVGCISLQPQGNFTASHERIRFLPTAEEILDIAVPHLASASQAVVSFGQGCEGEPLLQVDLIEEVIRRIRKETKKGVIHINTNASRPAYVERLARAGLNSIRISINSARDEFYERYYRPKDYRFSDVRRSMEVASDYKLFTSINLLTFPGFTDRENEVKALLDFIRRTKLRMIQWKNLNIDVEWYEELVGPSEEPRVGVRALLKTVKAEFPAIHYGYFNRPSEFIEKAG